MPKPLKKKPAEKDENELAHALVERLTGSPSPAVAAPDTRVIYCRDNLAVLRWQVDDARVNLVTRPG